VASVGLVFSLILPIITSVSVGQIQPEQSVVFGLLSKVLQYQIGTGQILFFWQ
jgi:hypothetical protein